MKFRSLIGLVALLFCGMFATRASAGMWTDLGRFLGYGVSNGYHAYNGCGWYAPAYYGGCSPKPFPGYTHRVPGRPPAMVHGPTPAMTHRPMPAMKQRPMPGPTPWSYPSTNAARPRQAVGAWPAR